MQQSVVQPINSSRGMAAKGGNGQSEFWSRRGGHKLKFYHCNKANKSLAHRYERRVELKQEIRFWEEDERLAFEADMKEMNDFFGDMEADNEDAEAYAVGMEDYLKKHGDLYFSKYDVGGSDDAYYERERMKAQLEDEFNYHTEPYYSGCPICGPLGCILD